MSEASHDPALARVWGAFFGELRRRGYVEGKPNDSEARGWLAAYSSELLWRIWPDVNVVPPRPPSAKSIANTAVLNAWRAGITVMFCDLVDFDRYLCEARR
jgi:hypothetical protein